MNLFDEALIRAQKSVRTAQANALRGLAAALDEIANDPKGDPKYRAGLQLAVKIAEKTADEVEKK